MTEAFIDADHSQDAEDMLEQWVVSKDSNNNSNNESNNDNNNSIMNEKDKCQNSNMFTTTSTKQSKHTTQLIMLTLGIATTTAMLLAFAVNRVRQSR